MTLTAEGRKMLVYVSKILQDVDELKQVFLIAKHLLVY